MATSRRSFLKGVAGTAAGVALAGIPELGFARPAWATYSWPPPPDDLLFAQTDLTTDASLLDAGCRCNSAGTLNYSTATHASIASGGAPGQLQFPGSNAALIVPAAGTLPRDEYTVRFDVINKSGGDFTSIPYTQADIFFLANAVMVYRVSSTTVAITNFWTGQGGTFTFGSGDWPNNGSKTFTIWWIHSSNTFEIMIDNDYANRIVSSAATYDYLPQGYPPMCKDDGIQLGGTAGSSFPFQIANAEVHRWYWPYTFNSAKDTATVTVDASTTTGAWADANSGVLGLYEGFWELPETTYTAVRDEQLALVLDTAGAKNIRFAGTLNDIDITQHRPGVFTYDFTNLDEKLDAMLDGRPNLTLHLSMDYTPAILQPTGGNQYSPPTNNSYWATICSDVITHIKSAYPGKLTSLTMWNEPDISNYWTGTAAQMYSLWATTQTKLLTDHPDLLMGNPEYAYTAGVQGFYSWLSTQSTTLKNSITAIYVHNYQQDLQAVRTTISDVRTAATNAGVSTSVPIRIPEYNLWLGQIPERHNNPNTSWYGTQPEHFTTQYAAAYAIAFLWEILDQDNVDLLSFGAIGTDLLFWDIEALVTAGSHGTPVEPYPANSAIQLIASLSGDRISAESNWPTTVPIATKDANGVITLIYANYKPYRGYVDTSTFDISWSGLPANFTWKQLALDYTTLTSSDSLVTVATGDQTDLPTSVSLGNLGIGAIQITP